MSAAAAAVETTRTEWRPAKRVAFRWAFLFLTMLLIPELIWLSVGQGKAFDAQAQFWRAVVPWIARHIFGVTREIRNFGTGDTGFANLRLVEQAMFAAIGAAIWTAVRRNTREYDRLYYWLRLATRYALANLLISYGIAKVFHVQFPYPPLTSLIQPLGQLGPQQLLWHFMGFSRPYQVFAGTMECGAAVLLFWGRTTTVGALLSGAALVNVLVMDWGYGVAVKLIVVRMLLFTVFLLLKDAGKLVNVLLLNRATERARETPPWLRWRWRWTLYAAHLAVIGWIVGSQILWAIRLHPVVDDRGRPPLYGAYRVVSHSADGRELEAEDGKRWTLMAFDSMDRNESRMVTRSNDEVWRLYTVKYDEANSRVAVSVGREQEFLEISRPDEQTIGLRGTLDKKPVEFVLRRLPDPEFRLVKESGLRWIFRW